MLIKFDFNIAIERTMEASCADKGIVVAIPACPNELDQLQGMYILAKCIGFLALKAL